MFLNLGGHEISSVQQYVQRISSFMESEFIILPESQQNSSATGRYITCLLHPSPASTLTANSFLPFAEIVLW